MDSNRADSFTSSLKVRTAAGAGTAEQARKACKQCGESRLSDSAFGEANDASNTDNWPARVAGNSIS
jgi:hypothetical protein